jgi:hypothetical protein
MCAMVCAGAQAVYLRTSDSAITGVAPYTTDADLALAPALLAAEPHVEKLMGDADFEQKGDPGVWWKTVDIDGTPTDIEVDLMVPGALCAGRGTAGRSSATPRQDDRS